MKISIIGAGNMGGAIARGLLSTGNYKVKVSNPSVLKLEKLKEEYPEIETTTENDKVIEDANVVVLAVKPYLIANVITEIKGKLADETIIVSLAAGISLEKLKELLNDENETRDNPIFIAIPDTAIQVRKGLTFICSNERGKKDVEKIEKLFSELGTATVIPEKLLMGATLLSSCGIAYAFKYIQACVQAGVQLGFKPHEALEYSVATVAGAMEMLQVNGTSPEEEIYRVTTPGGLTIKGVNSLEHSGFTSAIIKAIVAPSL